MRDFLLASCPILLWIIAAVEILLAVLLFNQFRKYHKSISLCMGCISIGLFLDAFFIAIGVFLPEGSFFQAISRVRFISHGVLIPLLFPICAYALHAKKPILTAVFILTGILMAAGLAESLALILEPKSIAGVVRYVSSDASPAWATKISSLLSYGTVVPVIICGIIAWIKQKTPCLFLAGFLMFAFSALGPATGNFDLIFFISMFGEVLMVLFFYIYGRQYCKTDR